MEYVCDSVHRKLGAFRHGRRNLSHAAKRTFYLSVLQSTLDYASSAYCHCLSQALYNRLITCSHIAMKKTFGLDRSTPTELVLRFCKLYPLELRYNLKLYVFVYRCLSQLASPLLQQLFVLRCLGSHSSAATRGQDTLALQLPRRCSRFGYFSISFLAADRWNSLPAVCRKARSPNEFATLVKRHLGYPNNKT